LRSMDEKARKDAEAIDLLYAQLRPTPGAPLVKQDELNKKISAASEYVIKLVYYSAVTFRQEMKFDPRVMERAIPLFRALIYSDKEKRFHQNHAQLGIALKDKCEPEWAEAEKELTTAIEIRGEKEGDRSLDYYEYHRSLCRIHLDENYVRKPSQPALGQIRDRILKDLDLASREYSVFIRKDDIINDWLQVNGIDISRFNPRGLSIGDSPGTCEKPGM
ncbi:MAG: hypothetical protein LUQ12_03665, partial [Methanoregulaceae archaeon]|nr:hypothetical protein [Methanoregulaceae archaeon]